MDENSSATTGLVDFYERQVLPNLFERLDQAFPEIRWTRTDNGWLGVERRAPDTNGKHAVRRLVCNQPWGFTAQDGTSASWLVYANGGSKPTGSELVAAVRKLAALAGVRDELTDQPLSRREQSAAHRATRYRELLEAFAAYCSACLFGESGKDVLEHLRDDYGIRPDQVATTSLGAYTNAADVREYLLSVGFSEEEIEASYVTRDTRLAGRATIPWRDAWGNLRTVVACDVSGKTHCRSSQLFLKGSSRPEFFGLDVALRAASGGQQHLLLVGSLVEAVVCHARSLRNVAACGNRATAISARQWQALAALGVRRATLALGDTQAAWQHTQESLTNWLEAPCSVQSFALARGALGTTPRLGGYAHANGNDSVRSLAAAAQHGCTHLAQQLVAEFRKGAKWNDADIVELLAKAVELDHRVTDARRAWLMERFFWPTILEAIELDWQDVRGLLERRAPHALATREETETIRRQKVLAYKLTAKADAHDIAGFEALILAAADELRQREKHWSPKVPVDSLHLDSRYPARAIEDHWQETLIESPRPESRPDSRPVTPPPLPTPTLEAPPVHKRTPTSGAASAHACPSDESIRRRAYALWENAGHPVGQHMFFWQEAERQLIAEGNQLV
jgi:hypothetical protein